MDWIDAATAIQRLGVRRQTLYAYVSRGLITARPADDDPRASAYSAQDIAGLAARKAGRSRSQIARAALGWGDPVLDTAISTVRDGRPVYRGRDAVDWSRAATLEATARLLRGEPEPDKATRTSVPASARNGPGGRVGGFAFLAAMASKGAPALGRSVGSLWDEASQLLPGFVRSLAGPEGKAPADAPAHAVIAAGWGVPDARADIVRMALCLLADHELNASTFAARVAASTGAPLAACALAGLSTLAGPLHGQAAALSLDFLNDARRRGPDVALAAMLARGQTPPGCGHPLYPAGDPRAEAILFALRPAPAIRSAIDAAEAASGQPANVDMALAALCLTLGLDSEAPFILFAAARMAGWLAHAIEQARTPGLIRPRARYTGP